MEEESSFVNPVTYTRSATDTSVTHSSAMLSPTPWTITRVRTAAGEPLSKACWEFPADQILPVETMHVAKLKLKPGYEAVSPPRVTLFGMGAQITVGVRFGDGGCDTVVVDLVP